MADALEVVLMLVAGDAGAGAELVLPAPQRTQSVSQSFSHDKSISVGDDWPGRTLAWPKCPHSTPLADAGCSARSQVTASTSRGRVPSGGVSVGDH
ncbi:hypothetical protein A9Z42_0056890 [Trichoderma parareesei]|uniref:Uncharacterized protein n=1 Tax=Trichoderma parareesei TaxID=858221 RepID=A0A2H2ZBH6_TRIPA|nr:hypothetical protein A9Z42_0056890 [Trichoderma parareesei]